MFLVILDMGYIALHFDSFDLNGTESANWLNKAFDIELSFAKLFGKANHCHESRYVTVTLRDIESRDNDTFQGIHKTHTIAGSVY